MEQTKAINALAPFLALSKSASSPRQAADIVTQATSASNTYVFAELLETPAIQSLRNDAQRGQYYKLLELFTWGTWADYEASSTTSTTLPPLNAAQTLKLRLLSLLSLAAQASSAADLTYNNLCSALGLQSPAALEELVTTAIYAGLVRAVLDPAAGLVRVTSVAPLRDLSPGSAGAMMAELSAWEERCGTVLEEMQRRIDQVRTLAGKKGRRDKEWAAQREWAEKRWAPVTGAAGEDDGGDGGSGGGAAGAGMGLRQRKTPRGGLGDMMDLDGSGGGNAGSSARL